jgi:dipeptidyl aminopeptidase/acylaminoacyl peptidase
MATERFQADDLLKQAMIQEVALSPDGETVVFSRRIIKDNAYQTHLWSVPYAGGAERQLTFAGKSNRRPRFSPDGTRLLFLSDRCGKSEPWVMPVAGGEARRLAELEASAGIADWSPDGTRILLTSLSGEDRFIIGDKEDPTARRITSFNWRRDGAGVRDQFFSAFVIPADGLAGDEKPNRITAPDYEVFSAWWSPDGTSIGFLADLSDEAALGERPHVWSIAADGSGNPKEVASLAGSIATASESPSGALATIGVDYPRGPNWANANLYLHEAGSGAKKQLGAELDRPIYNTTFGDLIDPGSGIVLEWEDADHVIAIVASDGCAFPYRFGTDGSVEKLVSGDYIVTDVAVRAGKIVVVATDRGRPAEVYAVEGGKLRALTSNGSDWLEPYRQDPQRLRIAHADGTAFDAWYIPARGNPRPGRLAIQIHGGPHGSHGPTPWLEMLALADAGIHVLYPNPHGSTGYGEAFTKSIHGAFGDLDGEDVIRLIDWAVQEGIADPKRVGIFGLSYGGYMTNWMLGHYPGRFAAGVSENPLANALGWYGTNDLVDFTDDRFAGLGRLPEDVEKFLERSPFMSIHHNEAPLLLLHAEGDRRCPIADSEQLFAILRSRGRTVELIRYPEEPHYLVGVGRPDRRVDRMQRTVEWFERYL